MTKDEVINKLSDEISALPIKTLHDFKFYLGMAYQCGVENRDTEKAEALLKQKDTLQRINKPCGYLHTQNKGICTFDGNPCIGTLNCTSYSYKRPVQQIKRAKAYLDKINHKN